MFRGDTPSSLIMSSFQTMSASFGPLEASPWNGPSFAPSANPSVSRHTSSPRFVT